MTTPPYQSISRICEWVTTVEYTNILTWTAETIPLFWPGLNRV